MGLQKFMNIMFCCLNVLMHSALTGQYRFSLSLPCSLFYSLSFPHFPLLSIDPSFSLSISLCLSIDLSLSLKYTRPHEHTHLHLQTHSLPLPLSLGLLFSFPNSLPFTRPPSLSTLVLLILRSSYLFSILSFAFLFSFLPCLHLFHYSSIPFSQLIGLTHLLHPPNILFLTVSLTSTVAHIFPCLFSLSDSPSHLLFLTGSLPLSLTLILFLTACHFLSF